MILKAKSNSRRKSGILHHCAVMEFSNLVFSGDKYWRFDDAVGRVELDYPRDISMWRGVPSDVDAAFQYIDGKTYFFKVNLVKSSCILNVGAIFCHDRFEFDYCR